MNALMAWVEHGRRPTAQSVAAGCKPAADSTCTFDPGYTPPPLTARVPAR